MSTLTSSPKRKITRADILSMDMFREIRSEKRAEIVALKRHRRAAVGPFITFYFENFATMWMQIHEMLYIEKGGEEQIADELAAYNPLIPQGLDLVATMMVEIDDAGRRARALRQLTHVERSAFIDVGGSRIYARAEDDIERTKADGKTSAIHFLHFDFTPEQAAAFKDMNVPASIGFDHPEYGHIATLAGPTRQALAADLAG
jgi:hypothetical protein